MSLDVYALCPCGSGKKLKFCCIDLADEIETVSRMLENNQLHAAEQRLARLLRKYPHHAWVVVTRAMVQLELGEMAAARDGLYEALPHLAEAELATLLYATAAFHADGYEVAKSAVHRAFQKSAKKHPQMVSALAGSVAAWFQAAGHPLAAREHLVLAMRLAPEEDRQAIFLQLLRFDGNDSDPFFVRGVHPVPNIEGTEEEQKSVRMAAKYGSVGCWDAAADLLAKLAEAAPEKAERWHALGLAAAYDGNEQRAVDAFRRAASAYADPGLAVECQTLATYFELTHLSATVDMLARTIPIQSVSRVLSILDQDPRLVRLPTPPARDPDQFPVSAVYEVLDRPAPTAEQLSTLSRETVPVLQGQISIYDASAEAGQAARLILAGFIENGLNDADDLLRATLGELAQFDQLIEDKVVAHSAAFRPFLGRWGSLSGVSNSRRREFEIAEWDRRLDELIDTTPFAVLGDRTIAAAAADPQARVAILALVNVLDAFYLESHMILDIGRLLGRLNVEPLPPLTVGPEESVSNLSALQMNRLPFADLSDDQLISVINRTLLLHHDRVLYDVLVVGLKREKCLESLDLDRVYQTLMQLSRSRNDSEAAIHWIRQAREKLAVGENAFQIQWTCDLRELMIRVDDPADPELPGLLQRFARYYGPKIPRLREMLEPLLASAGLESPWENGQIGGLSDVGGSVTAGGVWTPEAEAAPAGAGKLWLPGT